MKLKKIKKSITLGVISIFMISGIIGCNSTNDAKELPIATIKVKNMGEIKAELYPEEAPDTVENFTLLANSGYYNNLIFHKVASYAIQTGYSPNKLDYTIKGEFKSNGVDNNIKHERGVLSMIRVLNETNSEPSRFVILNEEQAKLDGERAAFGKVIEGMEIVDQISKVEKDKNGKPIKDVVIESIKVDTSSK